MNASLPSHNLPIGLQNQLQRPNTFNT